MSSFFNELKRRNVVRVGIAYVILCWLVVQVTEAVLPGFGAPEWIFKTLVFLLAIGFPFILIFAWAFERRLRAFRDLLARVVARR